VETDPDHADGLGNVCAIAPGVLGTTGIETGEIIQGIVERVKPVCVVAVDALAARSVKRVGTTIQLADSGINPGSGIGNHRQSLSQDTLGIPVIGVGVPTVVHAATIANDTVDLVMDAIKRNNPMASMPQMLGNLSREQTNAMIHEVLQPFMGDLVVTPKEIDKMTEDLARVVAGGMNVALHPDLDIDDTLRYIQ
jgi:spore protease